MKHTPDSRTLALEAIASLEPSESFDFEALATLMRVIAKVELAKDFNGMMTAMNIEAATS